MIRDGRMGFLGVEQERLEVYQIRFLQYIIFGIIIKVWGKVRGQIFNLRFWCACFIEEIKEGYIEEVVFGFSYEK